MSDEAIILFDPRMLKFVQTLTSGISTLLLSSPTARNYALSHLASATAGRVPTVCSPQLSLEPDRCKDLRLDGIRCAGDDLYQYLLSHPGLEILGLENFDTTGSTPFASTLEMLSKTHTLLQHFKARQIARNGLRLYLRMLGDIESQPERRSWCNDDPPDFFDDFERVHRPHKYEWTAEEWEGVQQKIGLMCEDVAVSRLSYRPEFDFGQYTWIS